MSEIISEDVSIEWADEIKLEEMSLDQLFNCKKEIINKIWKYENKLAKARHDYRYKYTNAWVNTTDFSKVILSGKVTVDSIKAYCEYCAEESKKFIRQYEVDVKVLEYHLDLVNDMLDFKMVNEGV